MKQFFTVLILMLLASIPYMVFAREQCKAKTKADIQCSRNATPSGYCKQHDPKTKHCQGKTKTGVVCHAMTLHGVNYCWAHQNQSLK